MTTAKSTIVNAETFAHWISYIALMRMEEIRMMKLSLKELGEEIEMILAEGGLTFDQVDYLLYLETCIADGSITEEQKREIISRDF